MTGRDLTPDDFDQLFRHFRFTAFRLEVQPVYRVEHETEQVAAFLRGEPMPPPEVPSYAGWLDQMRRLTDEGRRIGRVRVLPDPLTDYLKWETWAGSWNIAAGEDIRYLDRAKALEVELPLDYDWWLFDSTRLARMYFDPEGRPLGGDIIDDPAIVVNHCAWRDLAVHYSAPVQGHAV